MPLSEDESSLLPGERITRVILVSDVVDSVRLIQDNQDEAIRRWRGMVDRTRRSILPAAGGKMVKSTGDGMIAVFDHAGDALKAAFAMHDLAHVASRGFVQAKHMLLRVGCHVAEVLADEVDIFGHGVNLAARLCSLAGPGETVVSADFHDLITPSLDGEIEDLGENYVKNLAHPLRAYRVGPPGASPRQGITPARRLELRASIAVIPFSARSDNARDRVHGDVLADEVIAALSRTPELHVISRLSTAPFKNRSMSASEIALHLGTSYVLSGAYMISRGKIHLSVELSAAGDDKVVWAETLTGPTKALLDPHNEMVQELVAAVGRKIIDREVGRVRTHPLPTLESYALMMAGISMMHRLSISDFDRSRVLLQTVIDRAPREAVPQAWLGKWHVLRVQQGWTTNAEEDALKALDCTRRAIDADPGCSLAHAISGAVHTNLLKKFDVAEDCYDQALAANPNDSIAWLLKGTLHAFKGEGEQAVEGTEKALQLSPLDPMRYFYDSLAATAAMSAGRYDRAIELAKRSLRANRTHTSTLRALTIAQVRSGRMDEARETMTAMRRLEPDLTAGIYVQRNPSGAFPTGKEWAAALTEAGLPH